MSQISARLAVRVDSIANWEKLHSINLEPYGLGVTAKELFVSRKKQIVVGDDWACSGERLENLVKEIAKKNKHTVILADATDFNVEPYTFGVTYFGQKVETFTAEEPDTGFDLFSEVDISDFSAWITAAPCTISAKTQKYLKEFGIKCAVKKASAPTEYMTRFYFAGENLRARMASMKFLNTDRDLLPELEDPQKSKWNLVAISDTDASFEVPVMTEKEIDLNLKLLADGFDTAYILAWKVHADSFIFKWLKNGAVQKKNIPLTEFDLDELSILDNAGIGDVVDMRKLSAYLE